MTARDDGLGRCLSGWNGATWWTAFAERPKGYHVELAGGSLGPHPSRRAANAAARQAHSARPGCPAGRSAGVSGTAIVVLSRRPGVSRGTRACGATAWRMRNRLSALNVEPDLCSACAVAA